MKLHVRVTLIQLEFHKIKVFLNLCLFRENKIKLTYVKDVILKNYKKEEKKS